ncbi:MAG: InlB B-repeat-containing protein, partial [Erysipelotrichales bacterium]|nr:InlB B-repeat-containing protein [Erysipelotrichales bacterium]
IGTFPNSHQYGTDTTLVNPTRVGHTFLGWFLNEDGTGTVITILGANDFTSDIILYAAWAANDYTITFDVAGGNAISNQTVTFGQSFNLPTPTREGHTFNGWLHNGDSFTEGTWNIASDVTLVADWTANTYTITFDVAGGNTLSDQTVTFGENFTLPTPTKTGHTFAGWLHNGNPFTAGTWDIPNDITIVATWTANTYTITFDLAGGEGYFPQETITFGDDFWLPIDIPTREGHTFTGWHLNGELFNEGTWNLTNDITLVANWVPHTFTVTLHLNGGSLTVADTITVTFGESYELPIPTREGHTFTGWLNYSAAFPTSGTWNIAAGVMIFINASWSANTYTVAFDVNDGDALNPNTQTVTFGESYVLPIPTKTGYEFVGWHHNGYYVALTGTSWHISGDVTLVAHWSYDTFVITFDVNGGNALPSNTQTVGFGLNYTLPTPTRAGHTFLGWFNGPELVEQTGIWDLASNTILVAEWTANTYTITFDVAGGDTLAPMDVTFDNNYSLPTPTKIGHIFTGWFYGALYVPLNGVWTLEGNITLIATWDANEYLISFDVAGGDVLSNMPVTFGEAFTLPTPTRTGHTFNGWLHDGNPFALGIWNIPNDITLVATWTANTYTITFDVNQGDILLPGTQDVVFEQSFTLPTPTRTGYTFAGWLYNGDSFTAGIWDIPSNITLVATWTANNYTISFDVAGGDTLSDQTVTFDQPFTLPTPTRTGHTFAGWLHDGNPFVAGTWNLTTDITIVATWTANDYTISFNVAGGDILTDMTVTFGQSFTLPTPTREGHTFAGWLYNGNPFDSGTWDIPNNITLIATWIANNYTISFDVAGGDTLSDQTVTFDQPFTLPIPTRTGHTFNGWLHDGNAFDSGIWNLLNDITLVATWTANTYTIIFNVAGGDYLPYLSVTFGETFLLPTPTKTGYSFIEWLYDGNAFVSGTWNLTTNITIVAVWVANIYNITFDVAGGDSLSDMTVNFGQSFTLPIPTRTGYIFNGWLHDGNPFDSGTWNLLNDITLVATWTANEYTIFFNVTGGDALSDQTVTFGQSFTLPTPTRTGHTFNGWLHNGNPFTAGTWDIPNDITLTATWTANTYTISFDVAGGDALTDMIVTYGEAFTLPTATRIGYTFAQWLHSGIPFISGTWNIANDIALTATWTANSYTVTFDVNGGNTLNPNTQSVTFGQTYTLPTPTRNGHSFEGWLIAQLGEPEIIPQTGVWNLPHSVMLIAQWEASTFTVSFDVNGGDALVPNYINVVFGENYTLPTPTRTGHTFAGWEDDNYGVIIDQSGFWSIPNNITLTALWSVNIYTVELWNIHPGNGIPYLFDTINVTFGFAFNLPIPDYGPNWIFSGWFFEDEEGFEHFIPATGGTWNIPADVQLFGGFLNNAVIINFDVAGGTAIAPYNTFVGASVNLPTPVRTGHTFEHWLDVDGNILELTGLAWLVAGSFTLTAVWTANTYAITFDTTFSWFNISGILVTFGQTYIIPDLEGAVVGFVFNGWYHGTERVPLTGTWNIAEDITLVASFTAQEFTVFFDANGGGSITPMTVTYGEAFNLPTAERPGFTFGGWWSGSTPVSQSGTWSLASDLWVTAAWNAIIYTITFNVNGGDPLSPLDVQFNEAFTLPVPTREGFDFTGWLHDGNPFVSGTWYLLEDITIYANWTAMAFTVTFNVNGGDSLLETWITVTFGQPFTFPTPTRTGHTFDRWWDENGESWLQSGTWNELQDFEMTATWVANIYTVTHNFNGGNVFNPQTTAVTFGSSFNWRVPISPSGFFAGWWSTATGEGVQFTDEFGASIDDWTIAQNITVVARWTSFFRFNQISGSEVEVAVAYGITLPSRTITIPTTHNGLAVTRIAEFGFMDNILQNQNSRTHLMTWINIPNSIEVIRDWAFADAFGLTMITLPASVTHIGEGAFMGLFNLSDFLIPANSNLHSIGAYAFAWNTMLNGVSLPANLYSIGDFAFQHTTHLQSITLPGSVMEMGAMVFEGSDAAIYTPNIRDSVPSGWAYNWNSTLRPVIWGVVLFYDNWSGVHVSSLYVEIDTIDNPHGYWINNPFRTFHHFDDWGWWSVRFLSEVSVGMLLTTNWWAVA